MRRRRLTPTVVEVSPSPHSSLSMKSEHTQPGRDTAAAHRQEIFRDLQKRNERRARVAELLKQRREQDPWVDNAREVQRDLKRRLR